MKKERTPLLTPPSEPNSMVFCANGTTIFTGEAHEIIPIAGNRMVIHVKTLDKERCWREKKYTWYSYRGNISVTHMNNGMVQLTGPENELMLIAKTYSPKSKVYEVKTLGQYRMRLAKGTTYRI